MGDVCCRKDTFYNKPFDVASTTSKTPEITTRQDVLPRDSLGQSTASTTPDITTSQDLPPQVSLDQVSRCGLRNQPKPDLLSPRIAGGDETEEATFGEWPHMCIILKHTQFDGDAFDLYQCGASLISPGIILTAAHCVAYVYQAIKLIRVVSIVLEFYTIK